ncbi:MAG: cyclic nucleotide-binding/CBS domain-containing protein [Candidatus Nanohaloarchaea archaeon]
MENNVEIREVMTDGVIAVEQDETVKQAAELLEEEGIRGLVVVDEGEAVGVVVCRDIVYEVVSEGLDPGETPVSEVMSTDLIVAEADEYLDEVAMAMTQNSISRVPIVEGDMLTGIVTQSDILRAWPGYAEIIGEEIELNAEASPMPESQSGTCEECENYSEDLREVNGLLLCPECR